MGVNEFSLAFSAGVHADLSLTLCWCGWASVKLFYSAICGRTRSAHVLTYRPDLTLPAVPQSAMILVPSAAKPPAQVASRFIPHRPSTSCIGFSLEPLPHGRNKARSKIGRSRLFSAFPEISAGPALDEQNVVGMTELLNSLKWGSNGLVTVIVQVNHYRISFATVATDS